MKLIRISFFLSISLLLIGCELGGGTDSNVRKLQRLADRSPKVELPDGWRLYRSADTGLQAAVPADENIDETLFSMSDPLIMFMVSERTNETPEQIIGSYTTRTALRPILFKETAENAGISTCVFAADGGRGLYELEKIIVSDDYVYWACIVFNSRKPQEFEDERAVAFFHSFKVSP